MLDVLSNEELLQISRHCLFGVFTHIDTIYFLPPYVGHNFFLKNLLFLENSTKT